MRTPTPEAAARAILRRRLSAEQNHRCAYCGVQMLTAREVNTMGRKPRVRIPRHWRMVTLDEVVPRCDGGPVSWENCVAACRYCNTFKGPADAMAAFAEITKRVARQRHPHFKPWPPRAKPYPVFFWPERQQHERRMGQ